MPNVQICSLEIIGNHQRNCLVRWKAGQTGAGRTRCLQPASQPAFQAGSQALSAYRPWTRHSVLDTQMILPQNFEVNSSEPTDSNLFAEHASELAVADLSERRV